MVPGPIDHGVPTNTFLSGLWLIKWQHKPYYASLCNSGSLEHRTYD